MMTEEEAKKKWCPHVRLGDSASNRWSTEVNLGGIAPAQSCIGSGCMAWRWKETFEQMPSKGEATPEKDKPKGEGWHYELVQGSGVWRRSTFVTGYCGLAGKVET